MWSEVARASAPLLLGADPVSRVAELADLVDDRCIDGTIELVAAELFVDSDLWQLVAELHVPTQLPLVGDVADQVAARQVGGTSSGSARRIRGTPPNARTAASHA